MSTNSSAVESKWVLLLESAWCTAIVAAQTSFCQRRVLWQQQTNTWQDMFWIVGTIILIVQSDCHLLELAENIVFPQRACS
jgi:hypothetical protein